MCIRDRYKGLWLNDFPHGRGEFRGNNGERYAGDYEQGARQGAGTFVGSDGSSYSGEWHDDKPHGFGELKTRRGTLFTGSLAMGRQQGYGRQADALGNSYEGTWHAGKYHGFGELKRADGSRYQGEWHLGMRQGTGKEFYAAGGSHDGEWEGNQCQGPGTRITSSGVTISGLFLGESVTTGLLRLSSGAEYAGRLFRKRGTEVVPQLLAWVGERAEQGDAQAQFLMGTFYANFVQPTPDPVEAGRWYQGAARTYPEAAYRLGQLLLDAEPQRAITYLQQAAKANSSNAHLRLGQLFHLGQVVGANATRAKEHFAAALDLGSLPARNSLAWLLATSQEGHVRDPAQAIELIRDTANASENWEYLDTLAAAYAANQQFTEAVATQSRAIANLPREFSAQEYAEQKQALQGRLTLYEQGTAYIEVLEFAD